MNSVLVIGHFGSFSNHFDGQTIKTINFFDKLSEEDLIVNKIDTHGCKKHFFGFLNNLRKQIKRHTHVVFMLGENGLKVLTPLIMLFKKKKTKTHYVVVGGWLPNYLAKHPFIKKRLKIVDYIYVETSKMKKLLENVGFTNVFVLPNFKKIQLRPATLKQNAFKYCIFSRILKEKGVEEAIEAIKNVRKLGFDCSLDIFGPIDEKYKNRFQKLINSFPGFIRYNGVVDSEKSTTYLNNYYGLLFPTYYDGEGLAGTIIDAFSSGLPVIASKWNYNDELIIDGKNGYLVEPKSIDELTNKIVLSIEKADMWINMQEECLLFAKKFDREVAIKVFLDNL